MSTKDEKGYRIEGGWMANFLDTLLDMEIKGFYPTGSFYFGLAEKDSDIDFIVERKKWNSIHEHITLFYGKGLEFIDEKITIGYKSESIKFFYKDRIFNFIIVSDEIEYKIWVLTTRIFKSMIDISYIFKGVMEIKTNRIEMFETIKRYVSSSSIFKERKDRMEIKICCSNFFQEWQESENEENGIKLTSNAVFFNGVQINFCPFCGDRILFWKGRDQNKKGKEK